MSALTGLGFCPKLRSMNSPQHAIESIDRKIDRLIALCDQLNTERTALQAENAALKNKIDGTCSRLENLMMQLPEE
jgi:hypothetical protein